MRAIFECFCGEFSSWRSAIYFVLKLWLATPCTWHQNCQDAQVKQASFELLKQQFVTAPCMCRADTAYRHTSRVQLFTHWQQKLLRQWSKRLSVAVSATVTHYYMVRRMKLQSVQNAATWCDDISYVLFQLCWLPVWWWMEYKVACLLHQSLSGQTPAGRLNWRYQPCRWQVSLTVAVAFSDQRRTMHHNTSGDKSFTASGLHVWNTAVRLTTRHQLRTI